MPAPLNRLSPLNFSYFRMWKEAFAYATGHQKAVILSYHLVYVAAVGIDLQQPRLLGRLVNTLQAGGPDLLRDAGFTLLLIVLCVLGFWALHGPSRVIERKIGQEIYIRFITDAYARIAEMPLKWHQDHHSGGSINRVMTAATGLRNFVETGFISIQNLGQLGGSLVMLLLFNARIGALSFTAFVVSLLIISVMNRRMVKAMHENNEASHQANATFFDFVSNITSIIVLRLQTFSGLTLRKKLDLSLAPAVESIKINEWRWFIYAILNTTALALILLGYIYARTAAGAAIAAGTLVTVYLYQDRIGRQASSFLTTHTDWLRTLTGMAATQAIFDDHALLVKAEAAPPPPGWRILSLRHVDFSYRRGIIRTLHDVDLDLRRGEKVALIGVSGGGKSTLLSLLRGLHEPERAEMMIDGAPMPFSALSFITTLIPQDPEIFENTIRFNVSFGIDVPDGAVMEALGAAEFLPVLEKLPQGLDTDIREKGVNLSVGQKQRLALARGIFAAALSDIVLLDEPTSSVDLPTEEKIFANIFGRFSGKTVVATLHRLHLLPKFDRIVYLEGGRVTVDLPAAEALRQPGPVRDLYRTYQSEHGE